MGDDFETVNLRSRELEGMREHYRRHREALAHLMAEAPADHLADEYARLIREIDGSIARLEELGSDSALSSRPLVKPPVTDLPPADTESGSRVLMILASALLAFALIGWLIWRASSARDARERPVVESPPATTTPATSTAAAPASPALTMTPRAQDYGIIDKGARATRQFEILNHTEEPVSISIARSACRCLFYEHAEVVPPKGKESITVTIDAGRTEIGTLQEKIQVTSKSDPAVVTAFAVNATVR